MAQERIQIDYGSISGGAKELTRIWLSSSPTSRSFSPQTLSIDLSGYDEVMVFVGNSYSSPLDNGVYASSLKVDDMEHDVEVYKSAGGIIGSRKMKANANGITFGNATYSGATRNDMGIPLAITG